MSTAYRKCLGPRFEMLPEECKSIHAGFGRFAGRITVEKVPFAVRILSRVLGFPRPVTDADFFLEIIEEDDGDRWNRIIGDDMMTSFQRAVPGELLREDIGLVSAEAYIQSSASGIVLEPRKIRFGGLSVPKMLWPRVSAREYARDGQYRFEISVRLPFPNIALAAYSGWLDPAPLPPKHV